VSVVTTKNLTKVYRRPVRSRAGWLKDVFNREVQTVHALNDVSFDIHEGEFVAYVGLNGAGKTTTLKILAGILRPSRGQVGVLGHTPWRRERSFLKRIGYVMGQKSQLWWDLPALDIYEFLKTLYDIPTKKYRRTLGEMVEMLNAESLLNSPIRNLSFGERSKLELIAALLHDPEVVFLDEPMLGMDVLAQRGMRRFLADYNRLFGKTMLLTTHRLDEVESLCTRIIVIHEGAIVWDGSVDRLIELYDDRRIVRLKVEIKGNIQEVETEAPKESVAKVLAEWQSRGRVLEYTNERLDLEDVVARMLGEAP